MKDLDMKWQIALATATLAAIAFAASLTLFHVGLIALTGLASVGIYVTFEKDKELPEPV